MRDINFYKNITKFESKNKIKDNIIRKTLDLSDINISDKDIFKLANENKYKVVKLLDVNSNGMQEYKDYIVNNGIPVFQMNEWLDLKNAKRATGKKYANILCMFLNYLSRRDTNYYDVTNNIIEDYIIYRLYGGKDSVTLIKSNLRYKTIKDDITVIKGFYSWLMTRIERVKIKTWNEKNYNDKSYLYSEIGLASYERIIERRLESMESSREYIKWYTIEQVEAILSNLKTLRDKAIFLCTLDGGFRIDEALSIKFDGYNSTNLTITPSRTKSKKIRIVKLSEETCNIIDKYIIGERADSEYESGKYSEYLFININKGVNQCEPVKYNNFLKILKRAAKRAGLPQDQIKTHSGRSSKVMEYIKIQARHPELNLTDLQIQIIMGWEDINSIKAYRDSKNEELAMLAQEKIQYSKRNSHKFEK